MNDYRSTIPDYAKDLKLNIGMVLDPDNSTLSITQLSIIAMSCAYATDNHDLQSALKEHFKDTLNDSMIEGAKAAASIMAMNNIYYRFVHLMSDDQYQKMPAKLRMNIIANPGIDKVDFELACLAVSAINGCGLCMDSHAKTLEKNHVSPQDIQMTAKIAAVINGLAQVRRQERV